MVLGTGLPNSPDAFAQILECTFPVRYDIKMMINEMEEIKNYSLQKLGNDLCIERTGRQHQGGSDALLTIGICLYQLFILTGKKSITSYERRDLKERYQKSC